MILKFWNLPLNVWFFWTLALKEFVTCLSRWKEMRSLRILVPISAWLTFTSSQCTVLSPALVPNAIPGVAHRIPVHTFLPPPSLQGTLGIPRFKTRKDKKHLVKRGVYGGGGWRRKLFYLGLCMVIGKLVTGVIPLLAPISLSLPIQKTDCLSTSYQAAYSQADTREI